MSTYQIDYFSHSTNKDTGDISIQLRARKKKLFGWTKWEMANYRLGEWTSDTLTTEELDLIAATMKEQLFIRTEDIERMELDDSELVALGKVATWD